jgi:hypothetical protein
MGDEEGELPEWSCCRPAPDHELPDSPLHFVPALPDPLPDWFQSLREWVLPFVHFSWLRGGIRPVLFLQTILITQPMEKY